MRWVLISVLYDIDARLLEYPQAFDLQQRPRFETAITHFDEGYLEEEDFVVLLAAFYALDYQTTPARAPASPTYTALQRQLVFEKVRRMPFIPRASS
ncbi:hypothetical protein Dxin01_00858 [Deinococcus xinjiangensis]|uniref:Uncharacterized protein n=2 Tax=Deinococcus xinjiangensis TaxID=457454 RepID=A0ABP9VBP1_9DEIO